MRATPSGPRCMVPHPDGETVCHIDFRGERHPGDHRDQNGRKWTQDADPTPWLNDAGERFARVQNDTTYYDPRPQTLPHAGMHPQPYPEPKFEVGDTIRTRAELLELPAGTRLESSSDNGIWRVPNWENGNRQTAEFLAQLERLLPLTVYEIPQQPDYPAGSQRPQILADMKRLDEERRSPLKVGDYVHSRGQLYALAEHTVLEDKHSRQFEIPNERLDSAIRAQAMGRLVFALPLKIVYISLTPEQQAEEANLTQAQHDYAEGSTLPGTLAAALEAAFEAGAEWAYAHPRSER